jgi:hypothetical protein
MSTATFLKAKANMQSARGGNVSMVLSVHTDDSVQMDNEMAKGKRIPVQISLSEDQLKAMDKAAAEHDMTRSEYVRMLLAQDIQDFPDNLRGVGQYIRQSKD